jgi:hypothetical protein
VHDHGEGTDGPHIRTGGPEPAGGHLHESPIGDRPSRALLERGTTAFSPSPAFLKDLQRLAGNRATTRFLAAPVVTPSAASPLRTPLALQRSPESEALMAKLAVPQTLQLEGPEVTAQDDLVLALNREIDEAVRGAGTDVAELKRQWDTLNAKQPKDQATQKQMTDLNRQWGALEAMARNYENVTYIGAIILTAPIGDTGELIRSARLIDLPPVSAKVTDVKHSLQFSTYHLVQKARLENHVILNTLTTMDKAKQLEYLRKAGLPDKKTAIVIEVHYYRSRGVGETKIHKDTRGETLFVNLNFPNKKRVLGPEYIINPASKEIYDQYVRSKLPEVFVNDLNAVKGTLPGQKYIHATVIPENGIVAFVDEAIHHKTPTPEHRTARAQAIAKILQEEYGDEYDDAKKAYDSYTGASMFSPWSWSSYFKNEKGKKNAQAWWQLFEGLKQLTAEQDKALNRQQLTAWLPVYFRDHTDLIIEQAATDFTSVGYSHVESGKITTVPVRHRDEKPLKRQMSQEDLSQYKATSTEGGKRSFFRTWVRAVPREQVGI